MKLEFEPDGSVKRELLSQTQTVDLNVIDCIDKENNNIYFIDVYENKTIWSYIDSDVCDEHFNTIMSWWLENLLGCSEKTSKVLYVEQKTIDEDDKFIESVYNHLNEPFFSKYMDNVFSYNDEENGYQIYIILKSDYSEEHIIWHYGNSESNRETELKQLNKVLKAKKNKKV